MKKGMRNKVLSCLVFMFALILLPIAKVNAAGLVQTDASTNSITVSWTAEEDALHYYVYLSDWDDENHKWIEIQKQTLQPSQTSITFSNLQAGMEYKIQVDYDKWNYNQTSTYTYRVGMLYDAKTLPGKVTNVKQSKWWYIINKCDVTWDKQTAADGYEYIVKTNAGKKHASGTVKYNSLQVDKVNNTVVYTVQVRAYATINGEKEYGVWSNKCYCFTQPRITGISKSGSKLVIKWGKVKGATGYDVYMSTKPTKNYKRVKSVGKGTNKVTVSKLSGKKLSAKKTYYIYIVTKKKVGKTTHKSGRLYYWNSKGDPRSYGYFG